MNNVNDSNFCLSVHKYDKTLKDCVEDKGADGKKTAVKKFVMKNGDEILIVRDYARQLVRAVIDAYIELGSEEHLGLNMLENYLVISPPGHRFKNSLLHKDYDPEIKIKIVHKVTHPQQKRHLTDSPAKRNKAIMFVIYKHILEGHHLDVEWEDFRIAIKKGELAYCRGHPCLKNWEHRLLSFVKLSTMISNRSPEIAAMVYKAISRCTKAELYTDSWEQRIRGHVPLEEVRNFHQKKEDELINKISSFSLTTATTQSSSRQRRNYGGDAALEKWIQGGLLVKFIASCYRHLTESFWMNTNFKKRTYRIDDSYVSDENFRQLSFLDTLITHFVYPGLYVALYRELHNDGYDL